MLMATHAMAITRVATLAITVQYTIHLQNIYRTQYAFMKFQVVLKVKFFIGDVHNMMSSAFDPVVDNEVKYYK